MSDKTILNVSLGADGKLTVQITQDDPTISSVMLIGLLEQIKYNILSSVVIIEENSEETKSFKKYDT
jgi:hypothetical protein